MEVTLREMKNGKVSTVATGYTERQLNIKRLNDLHERIGFLRFSISTMSDLSAGQWPAKMIEANIKELEKAFAEEVGLRRERVAMRGK